MRLLHAGVPLKWIIDPNKTIRTAADLTASARLRYPSIGSYASVSFRTGPIAIFPGFETQAAAIINSYGNAIRVYELQNATSANVHSNLTHKPYVFVESINSSVHTSILSAAGLTSGTHYQTGSMATVTQDQCVTIITVPHSDAISTAEKNAVIAFVRNGGNFLAQCDAVRGFQSTIPRVFTNAGFRDDPALGTFLYDNAPEPSAQFEGAFPNQSGSLTSFGFTTDPPGGTRIVHDSDNDFKAYTGRIDGVTTSDGGYVHYLGGHDYAGDIDANRYYLNAVLRSAIRPTVCNLNLGPIAQNDNGSIDCGTASVTINVLANDTNPLGGPLTVNLIGSGTNGTFVNNNNGTVTYTGNVNGLWSGDQITYEACSGSVCDQATITITSSTPSQVTIGGTVFVDANNNGTLNGGETGGSGIAVRLYGDSNNNGVKDSGEPLVSSTNTTAGGSYSFLNNSITPATTTNLTNITVNDDSWQNSVGINFPTSFEESGDVIRYKGNRWTGLNIPANATITNATMTVTGFANGGIPVTIRVENLNAAPAYTSANSYLTGRPVTSNSVIWNVPALTNGVTYTTPDFASVVQQAVTNNNGLTNLSVILSNATGSWLTWNLDDGQSTRFQKLNLTYTVPGSPSNFVIEVDQTTLPAGSILTTDNVERANFTALGQLDCNNNFGYITCSVTAGTTTTLCINTALTPSITHTTTGTTGIGTATGLPAGVSASFASNTITISGTPTVSGIFNYSIPLAGGCGAFNATGTIVVTANNTASTVATTTLCINTPISRTQATTGATGIGTPTGLPAGVTATWASNTITFSGSPTVSGTFNYSIPLTGGCGTINATGTITVTPNNTATTVATTTLCINTPISRTQSTTGATGIGVATGLPAGVTVTWASNTITFSGSPTVSGTFNYSIPLTGGCGTVNATGVIEVTPNNTASTVATTTLCINTPISRTQATTGATGIGTATGLPAGVTVAWASNTITFSGSPTVSGTFNYSIPLTGGCGTINATGTIEVTPNNTASTVATTTLCINTPISRTQSTTGATGIGVATGLPAGVTATWAANTITFSGSPTASGTFNYSIPLTGGCGTINATGTITVTPNNTASTVATTSLCIGTAISRTQSTTGATGIGVATGLPAGVTVTWASNTITFSGSPTVSGTFNYSIPLTGGCGTVNATGTIEVTPNNTAATVATTTLCINTPISRTQSTTGATGIGTATGLPAGVTVTWASNTITFSGSPTASGTFNYSIPLTGGCGTINATGTITVTPNNTAATVATTTLCINTPISRTQATTGATGIGTATGLPAGVTVTWASNTITFSGSPTVSGSFTYSIPLTGGCGTVNATGTIEVTPNNTAATVATTTLCINTPISRTQSTTGATGIGTATGLPAGVTVTWASNTITFSGSPTVSGTFNYSIPLTGGCGTINATGTITVTPNNTAATVATTTLCIGTAITRTQATTGATGIGVATGLPAGVTATWASNTITFSGSPTVSGTFNYSIPLTGGCGTVNATGVIEVTPNNTATTVATTTLCINTPISRTQSTTGATGIGTATGLPAGVTVTWASNTITFSGSPTVSGTFNYSIPLTGGCGTVNATGVIEVTPNNTASTVATTTLCINTPISRTQSTTGATGIGTATGLPAGVTVAWASNTITFSGSPTVSGTFNYSIPLTGGCGTVNATGTITVTPNNTVATVATTTLCIGTTITRTQATTGATGIGVATGLPAGVTVTWASNTITFSGSPTASGTFNYSIPLTGGCGTVNATGTIEVTPNNTASTVATTTLCINTPISRTQATTGATGIGTATGLPAGVIVTWASNTITFSGSPTVSGSFTYSIPLTGGCGTVNATGVIEVTPNNTASTVATTTLCINTPISRTQSTTGATGIGTATGLPAGVTVAWASNTITFSGSPTVSGTFNYSIPLTGGCGTINATGTITVTPNNTVATVATTTLCIGTTITRTQATTGATGIGTATGLPAGVTATWASNTITFSGSPTVSGTFNYSIPLTGGCGTVNATGVIEVTPNNTASTVATTTLCINTPISRTQSTTGATGIGVATGLPAGVTATWASNTITFSGSPTASGTFNYSIPLTGGCGTVNATGTITVTPNNTVATVATTTLCIGTTITRTQATTGATGIGTATGLPAGVTVTWASNTITFSGSPTVSGSFTYSIPLTGGCGTVNATGTIEVTPNNTAATVATTTLCINTPISRTQATTGATGIGVATGLPAGVTATWASNTITFSGSPTVSGTFNYSIPLTGGCGTINATGTITVTPNNTAATVATTSLCIGTAISRTQATTGATGIGVATGLPAGVTVAWASNTITFSGSPTVSGTFNYSIPLTGGCGTVNATGTIEVTPNNTAATVATTTLCINTPISRTQSTTGATGIGTATGLPAGVTVTWASNTITFSGSPTVSGTFNYSIPLTGGCGTVNATGVIEVIPNNTASTVATTTLCINTPISRTQATTGATGIGTATGLPAGVTVTWASNTITFSGSPTASGTFNYGIPLTGGCGTVNATGVIEVTPNNTATTVATTTLCINTPISRTQATTGATGIGVATGLPAGVTVTWASNTITFSGSPTVSGSFTYSIPLTGGCGTINATGTITVTPNNTASTVVTTSLCIGTAISRTQSTTGATGIGTATGLPAGVTVTWASNTITFSGSPTVSGSFTYSIPLTGGCGTVNATGVIEVTPNNTASTVATTTLCINTPISRTQATTGATGIGTATGLPAGVTVTWASNTITFSGSPTASGTFNYSIPLTGGCGTVNATGVIEVIPNNTATTVATTTLCINTPISRTQATTGATGIGVATGLPAGVTVTWASNTITFSGSPTVSGTFNYSIPLTGGCGTINATGTITVTPNNTATTVATTTLCINTPISRTQATTGATGIGTATGLPAGVTVIWASNTITFSGSPTVSGTFTYSIPLTGGCGTVNATGTITVTPNNTAATVATTTLCINTPISRTQSTTGATGIGTATGLPAGVTVIWASNTITFSGSPTVSGTFNYSIPLTGGCGTVNATGTIEVTPNNTAATVATTTLCINTPISRTQSTTGATGIGVATGLPAGVTATWASNTITFSGSPTVSGSFTYSIPLTGGCGTVNATGTIEVTPNNTALTVATTTLCINTPISRTQSTTGATGIGTATGLPAGVTVTWASNTITFSGSPTVSGSFTYSIPLTGGCGTVNATGVIEVIPNNTASTVATTTLCINTPISRTQSTTGATGIGTATGLPAGVTVIWASNTITFSGSPTVSGTFNYSIPLTGGCGTINATGTITVTPNNTASTVATTTLCINTPISRTQSTTGATGIGVATGLPAGVTATWASNTITFSGSPTASGTFNYSIPLTGGCGTVNATGVIEVTPNNTATTVATTTLCINTPISRTQSTTGATGIGTATGLPAGVTVTWASNTITFSGSPTVSGSFTYSIPLTGGCGTVNATGTIEVTPNNTAATVAATTLCINTPISRTQSTTGATGIGVATGLPAGVTATWASNTITFSGSPTVSGSFTYSIPLTGGCGTVNATGTIEVTPNNTVATVATTTLCIGTAITRTQATTGATGIGTATGLPAGVTVAWASNTITFSGSPTVSGTFNYSIPLTGGCGTVNATGTITVTPNNTATTVATTTLCINTPISRTQATTGATGIGVATGLPAGVTVTWASNTITFSGSPTVSGTFNYSIPLTGGCGTVNATGTIEVTPNNTAATVATTTLCINTPISRTQATTGATGIGVATGLPAGVTVTWASNTITFSGSPTVSGSFTYSIPLTGGCGTVNATGVIEVTPNNTATTVATTTLCINTPISRTQSTTGATGIGVATGLPAGVTVTWASNTITFSGSPTASGTFNYSIPLTGGCGTINATGTITVTPNNTASTVATTTLCINTPISRTQSTTGATGIGVATGLPAGVTVTWASNTITFSGSPTASGTFNYSIPLTGGCGTINATGTITVTPNNTASTVATTSLCIGTAISRTQATTGATGIGVATGLPAGVTVAWASNTITFSGSPTVSGTFNYSIPLTGGCGTVNATGTIEVTPNNTAATVATTTLCINTPISRTQSTTGATGIGTATGLPAGVTVTWASNTITFSGSPTVSGTFNYSIPLTGGCGTVNATGTIVVNTLPVIGGATVVCVGSTANVTPNSGGTWTSSNTAVATVTNVGVVTGVSVGTATLTFTEISTGCIATISITVNAIPNAPVVGTITQPTCTSATGSVELSSLPSGNWTITRSPGGVTTIGNTTITTINGLPAGATYTFIVTNANTCTSASSANVVINTIPGAPILGGAISVCIGSTANVTPNTGGTWISSNTGVATITNVGIVTGVSAGTVNLTFTETSTGCSSAKNFTVTPNNTATTVATTTLCINTPISRTQSTTGATGIGTATGLPAGVTVTWASNTITFSGSPTVSGTFNYSIPLTGGCGTINATGTITVTPNNTAATVATTTLCIGTAITRTQATTGATGIGVATGLPAGVTATWASNTITFSGSPTVSGTFNYSIPLTGGCGTVNATGTIEVTPNNTATTVATTTLCINTPISRTQSTTGATGIGVATGLPAGVTATWSANTITFSGSPTVSGSFTYSIPLTGGCGTINATGTITVTPNNTATTVATTTLCINTPISRTQATTGAIGIGTATGLPAGVTVTWALNTITFSGSPTVSGTFNYSIPLTGGCGTVNATGTIEVTPNNTAATVATTTLCINTPISRTQSTTGATGIGVAIGLPAGVTATWASNTITFSGSPTASGTFNYSIPLTGGCGTINATGTITVTPNNTAATVATTTLCIGTAITRTQATTGATGIGVATGLPAGVTATWASNTITFSGSPTVSGTFNYSIPLTGGCGTVNATGVIEVTPNNTASTVATTTLCIGTTITRTQATTGATGIGTATGLPAGVTVAWASNTITFSGSPTVSGTFNYSIPLTGGCGTVNATGTIEVTPNNTAATVATTTLCINTPISRTQSTTGATGIGTATGLPAGVTVTWASNTITFSGSPTVSGTFNYSIPLTGGCGTINATGTITVTPNNTASTVATTTLCINTPISRTQATTGATGIGTATGLPAGVTVTWAANTITFSGSPTVSGTFNYSIPLTGGCGTVNATGVIEVTPNNTATTVATTTLCINTPISRTQATTGATGIGTATGLPAGVTVTWASNTITFSGSPTASGTFNYSIPLTGGCGTINATGTITVTPNNTAATVATTTFCINTPISRTQSTTGATGIGVATGLPAGVTVTWASNTITFSGSPTVSGTFNYSIPLTGGCGTINATGTITVTPNNTAATVATTTLCINTPISRTQATTGATGIGVATGLPAGVTATWASNTITFSGSPTVSGTFNYSIPLTGGCGTVNATGVIEVTPNNTAATVATTTLCINTPISRTQATTGATGIGVATGLPAGVTVTWAANTITFSGSPTASGTFSYSIPLTGGCGTINATGTITVTPNNTASTVATTTLCIGTAISRTQATTGATGIGVATGLPAGVTVTWASNTITFSGSPTVSGTFNYSIPLTGGCGTVNATGVIEVTPNNTATTVATTTLCINTPISRTQATTGATGIGVATGLPAGVTVTWASNTITFSGSPTVSGTFNYSIPLTGGCGTVNATGVIEVTPNNTASTVATTTLCINTPISRTQATTGATGIGTATGLPAGVTVTWASNTITFSGSPTVSGTFNYSIPLTGGCGTVNATGVIEVTPNNTATTVATITLCINTPISRTQATTGATGIGTATGLPAGVTVTWASNTITFSGSPTVSGTFNYSIPLTGGCGTVNATGVIEVTPNNTAATVATTTLCINTPISRTQATTGATGIGVATGLPAGVTVTWAANTITFSGSPTASGTFSYSIPLTGGCGTINATGTITVTPNNTASTVATTTLCINTPISRTQATTGATGIGTATGLPAGVTVTWASNTITFSGSPTVSGTFNYSIPLTGGCGTVNATGVIEVTPNNTATTVATITLCINTPISRTQATTGATGIGTATGLPAGVTVTWASNTITFSGSPTVSGSFTYSIPLTGGCGTVNATGTIEVTPNNTAATVATTTLCINTPISRTQATTGATGIGTATGLPAGVTVTWASNTITFSGSPTVSGSFTYSIPLTGGCGTINATGTITVTPNNTAATVATTTLCINTPISRTQSTTGATGIGTATGLPAGVTVTWASNTITFSGSPTVSGSFTYSIPLTGGCGTVNATGTLEVNALPVLGGATAVCVGSTANVTPNTSGTWISSNNNIATITNEGVVSGIATGTVTLTFTSMIDGCSNTVSFTITGKPAAPTLTAVQPSSCIAPNNTGSITVTAPTPLTDYTFSFDNGLTYQTSATASGLAAGTYQVVVKNIATECVSLATSQVINAAPIAPASPINAVAEPNPLCAGTFTDLSATCATGTLKWYSDAALTTTLISTSVNPSVTRSYYATCTLNGCESPATVVTVTVINCVSSIRIVKSQTAISGQMVGSTITYSLVVTNTGNTTLTNVTVTDPNATLSGTNPIASLAPNGTASLTAVHTITQADLNAGKVINIANVIGTTPTTSTVTDVSDTGTDTAGNPIPNAEAVDGPDPDTNPTNDPTETPLTQTPKVLLVKTASVGGTGAVNDVITYTFTVTNTGNVTLNTLSLADAKLGLTNLAVTPSTLAPAGIGTATATYTITQADINAGEVKNTATVTGTPPTGPVVTDVSDSGDELVDTNADPDTDPTNDPTVVPLSQTPNIGIVKTSTFNGTSGVITYTYVAHNTGNVTLTNVSVTEQSGSFTGTGTLPSPSYVNSSMSSPAGTLVPGETATYTATYAITQTDILAGSVTNQALASGTPPVGVPVTDLSDESSPLTGNNDPTVTPIPKVSLLPKAYLQGSLFGVSGSNLMRDDLRVKNLIPLTSPYPAIGYPEITTTGSLNPTVLTVTGQDAIVDWVFVQLRDALNNTLIVDSRSALIQRDGDIVDLDGVSPLIFRSAIVPNSYYVSVSHRNHLSVMSQNPIAMSNVTSTVDFRTPTTPTYVISSNAINQAQVVVDQGVALWAGNSLKDNKIIYQGTANDVNTVYQQVITSTNNLFVSPFYKLKGYFSGDINMNGEVIFQGTTNDIEFIYQNIIKNHPGNVLKQNNFIIREQLP